MRKVALALLLTITSVPAIAQSVNVQMLKKSLNEWQPLNISEDHNIITVTMKEPQITPDFYDFVAPQGICSPLWLDDKKGLYLKNIKEVRILNKFNAFGYVLETPRAICDEAGKAQPKESKVLILSKTRLFMGK